MDNHSMDSLSVRGRLKRETKIKDLGGDLNLRVDINP